MAKKPITNVLLDKYWELIIESTLVKIKLSLYKEIEVIFSGLFFMS